MFTLVSTSEIHFWVRNEQKNMSTIAEEDVSSGALWEALNLRNWARMDDLLKMPDVFDLVECRRNSRCNHNPEPNNDILFYICKCSAPLHILQSVHFIYQQLALTTNFRALLQWASNGGGSDVVYGFLLDEAPYALRGHEQTALHRAIACKRNPSIIKKILNCYPHVVQSLYPIDFGETPLELFFRLWENRLDEIREMYQDNFKYVPLHGKDYRVIHKIKEILLILLKAFVRSNSRSYHRPFSFSRNWLPLHEAIRFKNIPSVFILLLVELMPEESAKQDDLGNFPLHVAVSHNSWESEYVIGCILWQYPAAATIPNKNRRLPLALYIESGKGQFSDNLHELIQAAPDTISIPDTTTLLYPFMLALQCEKAHISVANDLLKMDPSLVKSAIPL